MAGFCSCYVLFQVLDSQLSVHVREVSVVIEILFNFSRNNDNVSAVYICFLNQARPWFLEIAFVRGVGVCVCKNCVCVCMCARVCVCLSVSAPRLLRLNNQLNKFYCFSVSLYDTCHRYSQWAWP